jgi:hypothetical protein
MRTLGFRSRFLGGVLALWFGLVMAAPAVLHGCPKALAAEAAPDAHRTTAPRDHHHPTDQEHGTPKGCQCLGSCAVATPAVVTSAAAVPVAVLTPVFTVAMPHPLAAALRPLPDHSQPFAMAPPLRTA